MRCGAVRCDALGQLELGVWAGGRFVAIGEGGRGWDWDWEVVVYWVKFGSSTGLLSTSHSPGFALVLWSSDVTLWQSRFGGGARQLQHNKRQCSRCVGCTRLDCAGGRRWRHCGRLLQSGLVKEARDHGMLAADDYAMEVLAWTRVVGLISLSSQLECTCTDTVDFLLSVELAAGNSKRRRWQCPSVSGFAGAVKANQPRSWKVPGWFCRSKSKGRSRKQKLSASTTCTCTCRPPPPPKAKPQKRFGSFASHGEPRTPWQARKASLPLAAPPPIYSTYR